MFHGWKICALTLSGNLMLQGSVTYVMNVFMEPLCDTMGWSRGAVNAGMGIATFVGQLAMPLMIGLSSRFALRHMMAAGALGGGGAMFFLGFSDNIWLFTLLYTLSCVATQACGGAVGNALVSNWFNRYRGRAFGLVNAGTSLSGAVLPLLALPLIHASGVKTAYMALGAVTMLLAPACLLLVRDKPEDLGLHADGSAALRPHAHVPTASAFSKVMRNPGAYALGIAFGLALMCGSGVMSQLKPRFADVGLAPWPAVTLACVAALCSAASKYFWGWCCDRFTPVTATHLVMLLCAMSLCIGFLPPTLPGIIVFCIAFGSCIGGLWAVLPAVVSYYFGNDNFMSAYKFISIFILLRCLGFPVMGLSHDLTGSYAAADCVFLFLLLVALLLTLLVTNKNALERKK
jgi:sugar phosphate permease